MRAWIARGAARHPTRTAAWVWLGDGRWLCVTNGRRLIVVRRDAWFTGQLDASPDWEAL